MSRRVVLGKRADSSFGLDVALPGYDALLDDRNDAGKFSFSSDWTDFVPVAGVGITGSAGNVPIIDNGYLPHIEVRRIDGLRIYDDFVSSAQSGFGLSVARDLIYSVPAGCFYIIYKTPMALQ